MADRPLPDVMLERYLAGDLNPEQRQRVEARLKSSPQEQARLATLTAEREAFLNADPPARFAHRVVTQLAYSVAQKKRSLWTRLLVPSGAAAAAALLIAIGYSQLVHDNQPVLGQRAAPDGVVAPEAAPTPPTAMAPGEPPATTPAPQPANGRWAEAPPADRPREESERREAKPRHDARTKSARRPDLDDSLAKDERRDAAGAPRPEPVPAKQTPPSNSQEQSPSSGGDRGTAQPGTGALAGAEAQSGGRTGGSGSGGGGGEASAHAGPPPTTSATRAAPTGGTAKKPDAKPARDAERGRSSPAATPPPPPAPEPRRADTAHEPETATEAPMTASAPAAAEEGYADADKAAKEKAPEPPRLGQSRLLAGGAGLRPGQDVKAGTRVDVSLELFDPGHVLVVSVRGKRAKAVSPVMARGEGRASVGVVLEGTSEPVVERLLIIVSRQPFSADEVLRRLRDGQSPLPPRLKGDAVWHELSVTVVP